MIRMALAGYDVCDLITILRNYRKQGIKSNALESGCRNLFLPALPPEQANRKKAQKALARLLYRYPTDSLREMGGNAELQTTIEQLRFRAGWNSVRGLLAMQRLAGVK